MKYLLLIALVVVAVWAIRRAADRRDRVPAPPPSSPAAPRAPAALEDIVRCEVCGLNLPKSEALPGRGGHFCGEPHRREHEQRQSAP